MEEKPLLIRANACYICERFDSIVITKEEAKNREIGLEDLSSFLVAHNDHMRTIFFDSKSKYHGDRIDFNEEIKGQLICKNCNYGNHIECGKIGETYQCQMCGKDNEITSLNFRRD